MKRFPIKKDVAALSLGLAVVVIAGLFAGCNSGTSHASGKAPLLALKAEPDVEFKDLHGTDMTLESLKGKVVFVNFWATWCDPCREEIPWLIDFQQKYASKGFTVLGIAMDEDGAKAVDPFVQKITFDVDGKQMLMNYPIVLGNDDILDKFGGSIGYPVSFLITRDGKIRRRYLGMVTREELDAQIKALLGS